MTTWILEMNANKEWLINCPKWVYSVGPNYIIQKPYESYLAKDVHRLGSFTLGPKQGG